MLGLKNKTGLDVELRGETIEPETTLSITTDYVSWAKDPLTRFLVDQGRVAVVMFDEELGSVYGSIWLDRIARGEVDVS
jgi:hypothetical protein